MNDILTNAKQAVENCTSFSISKKLKPEFNIPKRNCQQVQQKQLIHSFSAMYTCERRQLPISTWVLTSSIITKNGWCENVLSKKLPEFDVY